jgi:hypothetical protein
MTLPNFIIAGTARSGTTSLYYYLKQHPQIGFPDIKEPKFLSSHAMVFPHNGVGDHTVDNLVVRGLDDYLELFEGLASFKRVGDASSDTLYNHKHTATEIRRLLGDVPIVICLRDPAERAVSAYNNMLRDQRETLNFKKALDAEEERIANNWDWMWAYKTGGLYAAQVASFQRKFSKVKVILFEELVQDTNTILRDLFEFLEVDPNIPIDYGVRYGNSGKPKNKFIGFLTNRENSVVFRLRSHVIKLSPRFLLEWLASRSLTKVSIKRSELDELRDYFRHDIESLEKLIGRNLEGWK